MLAPPKFIAPLQKPAFMKRFLPVFFLLFVNSVLAQYEKKAPYRLQEEIMTGLRNDTTPWKYEFAAEYLSCIGAYPEMLAIADSVNKGYGRKPALSVKDSLYVRSFHPKPAREYIVQRAEKEQVLIINEAHHQPLHRTFVTSLLKGLYAQGYRYLGLETLGYKDSMLNLLRYPLQESGYYSKEPQFGNLIREALRLGFTLFSYETNEEVNGGFHNGKFREIDQARNIAAFMKKHPGKYLIHCGYAHVIEGPYPSWEKAMAGRLKEYTGINPFTIYQEALTEHSSPRYEEPDYGLISFPQPAVLINKEGSVYNGYARDSSYDVRLYHPRTQYVHGRPDWLSLNGSRKPFMIDAGKISLGYPVLILAYVKGEDVQKAVPYDVMELSNASDKKALFLEKGPYTVILKNQEGKSQQMEITIR